MDFHGYHCTLIVFDSCCVDASLLDVTFGWKTAKSHLAGCSHRNVYDKCAHAQSIQFLLPAPGLIAYRPTDDSREHPRYYLFRMKPMIYTSYVDGARPYDSDIPDLTRYGAPIPTPCRVPIAKIPTKYQNNPFVGDYYFNHVALMIN